MDIATNNSNLDRVPALKNVDVNKPLPALRYVCFFHSYLIIAKEESCVVFNTVSIRVYVCWKTRRMDRFEHIIRQTELLPMHEI